METTANEKATAVVTQARDDNDWGSRVAVKKEKKGTIQEYFQDTAYETWCHFGSKAQEKKQLKITHGIQV